MILSQPFFDITYRPEAEDNYDYLVKNKKKKAGHKQVKATVKRQVKAVVKHPLRAGFGLFKQVGKQVGANMTAVKKIINTPLTQAYSAEQAAPLIEPTPLTEETTPAAEGTENQSAEDNATGPENELTNEGKKKTNEENNSNSPLIGIFFLGLTFFMAAYALYRTDKKSGEHIGQFK